MKVPLAPRNIASPASKGKTAQDRISVGLVALVCTAVVFALGTAVGWQHAGRIAFQTLYASTSTPAEDQITFIDLADLSAQQWMATWAMWMFVASLLGVAASLYSIVLVSRSLTFSAQAATQARLANEIARQSHVLENRPWLTLDAEILGKPHSAKGDDGAFPLAIKFSLSNLGVTPATQITLTAQAFSPRIGYAAYLENESVQNSLAYRAEMEKHGSVILFPGKETSFVNAISVARNDYKTWLSDNTDEHLSSHIIAHATYKTILDDNIRHTAMVFVLSIVKDPQDQEFLQPAKGELRKMFGAELVT